MKVYEKILQVIKAQGVRHLFGVPGDAINPLMEAIHKDPDFRFIHVSHEESGAFAASAAGKLSGNLQVCASTVGPGAIHLLNGLYDAKRDHVPVLALLGQVPTEFLGTDYHQEVDLPALFNDVADLLVEVRDPAQLPHVAVEACNWAMARRAVCVLVLPHDVASQSVADQPIKVIRKEHLGVLTPAPGLLDALAEQLKNASRPCLMVGEGARGAAARLTQLAAHLGSPVVYSLRARDMFQTDDPWVAGGLGLLGTRGGVVAMKDCDLLLMLGTDFPYRDWLNHEVQIVQVDDRAQALGRRCPGAMGIHADVSFVVQWLLEHTPKKEADAGYLSSVAKAKSHWDKLMAHQENPGRSAKMIHPQAVARALSDLATDDAIFTCDTGEVTVWGARHLAFKAMQRFTASFNLASMAYAMPAAIGAQLQYPDRQVISLSGDGGFNMLMGDFLTAVKYQLPIKVIIFNNGKLGLIKMEQAAEGYPESETDLQNPDYVKLAQAMGASGFEVHEPDQLITVLREALLADGPVIVDVKVNPDEITWPPKIEAGQAVGFGLAKVRELFGAH